MDGKPSKGFWERAKGAGSYEFPPAVARQLRSNQDADFKVGRTESRSGRSAEAAGDTNQTGGTNSGTGPAVETAEIPRPQKRRGRRPGPAETANATQQQGLGLKVGELADQLQALHIAAAMGLSTPELVLSADEAKVLADRIVKVSEFYPVTINPKYAALMSLIVTAGMIYGPRINTIVKRKAPPKTSGATPSRASNVVQFPQEEYRPDDATVAAAAPAPINTGRQTEPLGDFTPPTASGENGGRNPPRFQ